jgi:RHS repeat-associated protein
MVGPSATDVTTYTYDATYRLTKAEYGDETVDYAYDGVGNRTHVTSTVGGAVAYTYDDADRLTAAGAVAYTNDASGNRTAKGATTAYSYDYENRLTAVVTSGVTTTYRYNGDGLRVEKDVGGGSGADYVWDVGPELPVVLDDGEAYVYGLDLIAKVDDDENAYHYLYDGLGSTVALADESGAVVSTYAYDAYGEVRSSTGSEANEYRFTGEQADDDSGLVYLRARYYDPETGRFLTKDPFEGYADVPASLNRYTYAHDNPVNLTDPSGQLIPLIVVSAGVGGVIGGSVYLLTTDDPNLQGFVAASVGGAVSGGLGVIATPIAAVLGLGTGVLGTAIVSGGIGVVASGVQAALDPCLTATPDYLLVSGASGYLGGALAAKWFPLKGAKVFRQKGWPRTYGAFIPKMFGGHPGPNSIAVFRGAITAVTVGASGPTLYRPVVFD